MTPKVTSPAVASPAEPANSQNARGSSRAACRSDVVPGVPDVRACSRNGSPVRRRSHKPASPDLAPSTEAPPGLFRLEQSLTRVLSAGYRTPDIAEPKSRIVGGSVFTEILREEMQRTFEHAERYGWGV